ncbi:hypothetical protein SAMN04487968_10159 [Nocardioides terrae]|uniref:Uncharacterized protein n=1 Tax=Nocardioides terrae TaxID=574651 RepID=A0A1I1D737_9ACTN|nr:hypothetical protein [Nocardioides terrae]SFB70735.1 hypothetical protein SAMN04487968_10159 [Nocardioides terrae]
MESDEVRRALRDADRAEAAPWTDYPPTPRWYPPAVGVWAALVTLAFGEIDSHLRVAVVLALVAVEIGFVRWYVRHRGGVMPTGAAPREFRGAIVGFVVAAALIVIGTWVLVTTVDGWVGAAVALVTTTVAIGWYERAYAEAANRARERLG